VCCSKGQRAAVSQPQRIRSISRTKDRLYSEIQIEKPEEGNPQRAGIASSEKA
jgi:hypothetical protein